MKSKNLKKRVLSAILAAAMVMGSFSGMSISARASGAVLWVDAVNGSDSNDGSSAASAFKTIEAAKSAAAQKSEDSDVTVYVKGGTYQVTEAIKFGAEDSGKNGHTITYKAAEGETPVISGGTEVTGWTLHDEANNIWKASISEKAAESRQFYVDGEHQTRAMTEVSPTSWEIMGSGGYVSPYVESQDTNEYVIMDLGEVKTVSYVTLYPNAEKDRDGRFAGFPEDLTIETSLDGNTYEVQYSKTGLRAPGTKKGVTCSFDEVQARYVKLNVTKLGTAEVLRPGEYALSLSEMEVGVKSTVEKTTKADFTDNILTSESQVEFVGYYSADGSRTDYIHGGTPKANLVDGNTGTITSTGGFLNDWLSGNGGSLTPAFVVDVSENGASVPVSAIELNSRVEGGTAVNYASDFKVQVTNSADPKESDWETLSEQTDFKWTDNEKALFLFKEREVKKIRITASKLGGSEDGSTYMLQFKEMAVYHDKTEETAAVQSGPAVISEPASEYGENLLTDVSQILLLGHYQDGKYTSNIHGALPISNLIDGNKATFASTGGYLTEWFPGNLIPTLTVDVSKNGKAVPVSMVQLTARSMDLNLIKDFTIQVAETADPSEDDWKTVVTKTGYTWDSIDAQFTFDAVNAYQVRIQVTAFNEATADSGHYYLQFAEVEIYGPAQTEETEKEQSILTDASQIKFFGYQANGAETSYINDSYPLSNLMDGDKETFISSNGFRDGWLAADGGTLRPYLVVDLSKSENPAKVTAIEISGCKDNCQAKDFKIQISSSCDSTEYEWTTVASETDYDWSANPTYRVEFEEPQDVCEIRVEAIRLQGKINETDYQFRLTEMAVYGTPAQGEEGDLTPDPTLPDATIIFCGKSAEDAEYTVKHIEAKNENPDATYNSKKLTDGCLYDEKLHYGYNIPQEDAISLTRPQDLEINVLRWWYHRILKVSGMSDDGTEVYFDDSVLSMVQQDSFADNVTWLENAYEFIDNVGEWYINKDEKVIYYKADGTMEGKTAVLPVTEQLLVFDGCSNVTFDGFEFVYTTWTRPSVEGHIDAQSGTYHTKQGSWGDIPGSIQIGDGSNIKLTNSRIHNVGTGGVRIMNHTSSCEISGCAIYDTSSVGIWVGNNYGHNSNCGEETLVKDNVIRNNYITRVGLDIYDSSGITVLYTNGTIVDHNEICNTPYTGISLGWGWDWNPSACAGNNTVSNNFIHDTGLVTHDGGSIYTLGNQTGSKLTGNYVYSHGDPENSKDIGLYLDEGSSGIEVYENVVGPNVYWWSSMWTASIKNNHWHDNYHQVENERDNGTNNVVENNTYVPDGDFSKYPKAQAIIDNAGLLDKSVKTGVKEGASVRHQVSLTEYENCPAYYFSQEDGLTSFEIEGQIGNTQYNRRKHTIEILMPEGTDVTALTANLVCRGGYQLVGTLPKDYTQPVVFQLETADDVVTWTVKVKVDVTANGELTGTEVTLDDAIKNTGDWTVSPVTNADGSITFSGSNSSYIGKRYAKDAILEFDMKMKLNTESKDWAGFAFRVQNTAEMLGTMYHVCINNDCIEVQKWVNGERTMLYGTIEGFDPVYGDLTNDYFTADERHSIKTGAIDVPQGVRLFMYVNGNKVFDIIDADNPITGTGFFTVYPMTQAITLFEYSNIEKITVDLSTLKETIAEAEKVEKAQYTEESVKALETALADAKAVLKDENATQSAVNAAVKALSDAMKGLKEKAEIAEGLNITGPKGTVDLYSESVKAYLNKESGSVWDYYKSGTEKDGDASLAPVTITWTDSDDSQITKYVVEYATRADYSDAVKVTKDTNLSAKEIDVYNLYKAATYYVRITSYKGNTAAAQTEATFRTTGQGPRVMKIDSLYNVRDLGGYLTADGKRTLQGMIYRGCEMNGEHGLALSEAGNDYMSNVLGIKLDLDLRADDSETPISSATKKFFPINGYEYAFTEKEYYRQIFAELADESNYPVYIHCWGGADRTGTVAYLINALLGVSEEELIQDYELTSWSIFSVRDVNSTTYNFSGFVSKLKEFEGATLAEKTENYMLSIGVTEAQIASIRKIMLGEEADTKALKSAVENAEKLNKKEYTEESVKALETALADAKAVLENKNATQTEVDNALILLNKAVEGLVKKTAGTPSDDHKDQPTEVHPAGGRPSGSNTGTTGTTTGDPADIVGFAAVLIISAIAAAYVMMKKRRENA